MASGIFISYIIPCYNVQDYLRRCLNSLVSQELTNDLGVEFVLVNDGSTDNTLSILNNFAKSEERAIVIDQKNEGVSAARNSGLKVARGKYVFFLDSDDWLTDEASLAIYDICKESDPDIVVTNAYTVREGQWDVKKEWNNSVGLKPGVYETLDYARLATNLPISFKAYRRDMLEKYGILYDKDLRVGEVYTFFLHVLAFSKRIAFTDKHIMNYVFRQSSVMRTVNFERDKTILSALHRIDTYANSQMSELIELASYKRSLFDIVNMFSIHSFKKAPYTTEVGNFFTLLLNDNLYKDLQKYFIFQDKESIRRTSYAFLFYFFPIPIAYRLLRLVIKLRNVKFF